jgi:hypothetical protein
MSLDFWKPIRFNQRKLINEDAQWEKKPAVRSLEYFSPPNSFLLIIVFIILIIVIALVQSPAVEKSEPQKL